MSTSIRRGIQAVHPVLVAGILIGLGDQPFLKTRTVNVLIHAFDQEKGRIIIPSFRGRRGHPVIFHRRYKKELLNLEGDVGGRSVIEWHPEDVRVVPVRSIGVVRDVDTWQDYNPPVVSLSRKRLCRNHGWGVDTGVGFLVNNYDTVSNRGGMKGGGRQGWRRGFR